ncbi:MAG: TIGR02186 family protein [Rhodospirillales bacterium]
MQPATHDRAVGASRNERWKTAVVAVVAAVMVVFAAPLLRAQDLVIDLSNPVVAITAGFSGTDLLLFGATSQDGDVAVVVRGPQENHVVRVKERVAGIWVNGDEITFTDVPSYYAIAANRPIDDFVPAKDADIHQIGKEHLLFKPLVTHQLIENPQPFADALLRIKQAQGLYAERPNSLSFLGHGLFRTNIHFPANVSVGTYGIDVYLFQNGELVDTQTSLLNIRKFGVEASIFDFAHRYSLAYGILAVLVAAAAGWFANAVFARR